MGVGDWIFTGGIGADEVSNYNSSTRAFRLASGFSSDLQPLEIREGENRMEATDFLVLAKLRSCEAIPFWRVVDSKHG